VAKRSEKWRGKGAEEDLECDGRTVLRETLKQWEENGEQQLDIVDRERSERKVRTEKTTVATPSPSGDDRDNTRRTTSTQ